MSKQELSIQKKVYERGSVSNVINRDFTQLIPNEEQEIIPVTLTIDEFFEEYERLFFEIPKEGEFGSHQYLISKSSDYIGAKTENSIDVQLLQDEITALRQQLLESNQALENIKISNTVIK